MTSIRNHLFNAMTMDAEQIKAIINKVKRLKKLPLYDIPKILKKEKVTIVTTNQPKQCLSQIMLWSVTQVLGGTILPLTFDWSKLTSKQDLGKMISRCYDLVLLEAKCCSDIFAFAEGCSTPMIYCACRLYQPLHGIANILTIEEHFRRLNNLKFSWIGPGCQDLNTFMMILPKFGIPISYNCTSNPAFPVNPICYEKSSALCKIYSTSLNSFNSPKEALRNAHIIATTEHGIEFQKITLEMLKEADENWIFLHSLPSGKNEASSEVFNHERNLTWKNFDNLIYVCIAVIFEVMKIDIPTYGASN